MSLKNYKNLIYKFRKPNKLSHLVDENIPTNKQETLESTTQTLLSVRHVNKTTKSDAKTSSETAPTRSSSRRSQASKSKSGGFFNNSGV